MARPHAAGSDPPPRGEPGQARSPVLVPFLSYVSLQFYLYYWVWQVADELDRFDPYRRSPRSIARWAVPLAAAGQLVAGGALVGLLVAEAAAPASLDPATFPAWLAALLVVLAVGGLAYLAGSVLLWVALWRTWSIVEPHEAAVAGKALNPGLLMTFWIASALVLAAIPVIGWAVQLGARSWVLYRTQRGLNRVWAAARDGYEPSPPQPAALHPDRSPSTRGPARDGGRPAPPDPGPGAVDFRCRACGNHERIPPRRPLKVTCPACGEAEILE